MLEYIAKIQNDDIIQQEKNPKFKYFNYDGKEKTKKLQVTSKKIYIAGQTLVVTSIRDLTKWVKFEKQR